MDIDTLDDEYLVKEKENLHTKVLNLVQKTKKSYKRKRNLVYDASDELFHAFDGWLSSTNLSKNTLRLDFLQAFKRFQTLSDSNIRFKIQEMLIDKLRHQRKKYHLLLVWLLHCKAFLRLEQVVFDTSIEYNTSSQTPSSLIVWLCSEIKLLLDKTCDLGQLLGTSLTSSQVVREILEYILSLAFPPSLPSQSFYNDELFSKQAQRMLQLLCDLKHERFFSSQTLQLVLGNLSRIKKSSRNSTAAKHFLRDIFTSLLECSNPKQVEQIKQAKNASLFQKLHKCMDPSDIIQILRQVFLSCLETSKEKSTRYHLFGQLPLIPIVIYQLGRSCTKFTCAIFDLGHEIAMEAMQQMNASLLRQALRLIAALDAPSKKEGKNDEYRYYIWFAQHFGPPPPVQNNLSTSSSSCSVSTSTSGSTADSTPLGSHTSSGLVSSNVYFCPRGYVNGRSSTSTSACILIQNKRNLEFFSAFLMEEANSSVQAQAPFLHVHIKVLKQHQRVAYPHALVDVISCLRQNLTRHTLLKAPSVPEQLLTSSPKDQPTSKDQLWMESLIENMPINRTKASPGIHKKLPPALRPILLFQKQKFQQQMKFFFLQIVPNKPLQYSYKQATLVHVLYQEKLISQREYELFLQQMERHLTVTTCTTRSLAKSCSSSREIETLRKNVDQICNVWSTELIVPSDVVVSEWIKSIQRLIQTQPSNWIDTLWEENFMRIAKACPLKYSMSFLTHCLSCVDNAMDMTAAKSLLYWIIDLKKMSSLWENPMASVCVVALLSIVHDDTQLIRSTCESLERSMPTTKCREKHLDTYGLFYTCLLETRCNQANAAKEEELFWLSSSGYAFLFWLYVSSGRMLIDEEQKSIDDHSKDLFILLVCWKKMDQLIKAKPCIINKLRQCVQMEEITRTKWLQLEFQCTPRDATSSLCMGRHLMEVFENNHLVLPNHPTEHPHHFDTLRRKMLHEIFAVAFERVLRDEDIQVTRKTAFICGTLIQGLADKYSQERNGWVEFVVSEWQHQSQNQQTNIHMLTFGFELLVVIEPFDASSHAISHSNLKILWKMMNQYLTTASLSRPLSWLRLIFRLTKAYVDTLEDSTEIFNTIPSTVLTAWSLEWPSLYTGHEPDGVLKNESRSKTLESWIQRRHYFVTFILGTDPFCEAMKNTAGDNIEWKQLEMLQHLWRWNLFLDRNGELDFAERITKKLESTTYLLMEFSWKEWMDTLTNSDESINNTFMYQQFLVDICAHLCVQQPSQASKKLFQLCSVGSTTNTGTTTTTTTTTTMTTTTITASTTTATISSTCTSAVTKSFLFLLIFARLQKIQRKKEDKIILSSLVHIVTSSNSSMWLSTVCQMALYLFQENKESIEDSRITFPVFTKLFDSMELKSWIEEQVNCILEIAIKKQIDFLDTKLPDELSCVLPPRLQVILEQVPVFCLEEAYPM